MSRANKGGANQPHVLDWDHFQEYLKARIPWVVISLQVEDNKYQTSVNPKTYVSIDDIKRWRDERKVYMIYDKSDKLHSILLRPDILDKDQIEEEAKFVPIQYRKDGGQKEGEKPNITKDNPPGLRNILKRNEPNINKDKKKGDDQNKNKESDQNEGVKIVNYFVFNKESKENDELKKKFVALYSQFEKENK